MIEIINTTRSKLRMLQHSIAEQAIFKIFIFPINLNRN